MTSFPNELRKKSNQLYAFVSEFCLQSVTLDFTATNVKTHAIVIARFLEYATILQESAEMGVKMVGMENSVWKKVV